MAEWRAMNIIKILLVILGLSIILLAGCSGDLPRGAVGGLVGEINDEVIKDIRKNYPLPDGVVVNNANGDVVNYTTSMSVDKVVEFYRQEYAKQGVTEMADAAAIGGDSAKIGFHNSSTNKNSYIQAVKQGDETKVHLEKK
jgi:hypothetical protein